MRLEPLTSFADARLLPAMRIYAEAFPPHEQMSTAFWLETVGALPQADKQLYAIVGDDAATAGMIYLELVSPEAEDGATGPVAFLWYLCTHRDLRGAGVGAAAYAELVRRLQAAGAVGMVFEVEQPEEAERHAAGGGPLAQRRIGWYRRNGARLLKGVRYFQTTDNGSPPVPMHLMVHPFRPVSAEEAYRLACIATEETVERDGALSLE